MWRYVVVASLWKIKLHRPKRSLKKLQQRFMNTETWKIRDLLWFPFWTILVEALLKEQNEPHNGDNILWYFYSCILGCFNSILLFCYIFPGFFFLNHVVQLPSLTLTATFTKSINVSPKRFIVTWNTWSNFSSKRGIIWPSMNSVKTSPRFP